MRLTDLDPFWIVRDGERVGFSFISPTDPNWRQIVTVKHISIREQWALTNAERPGSAKQSQTGGYAWIINNGAPIAEASFKSLSVTPSVDGSKAGLWHGFITNGSIQ